MRTGRPVADPRKQKLRGTWRVRKERNQRKSKAPGSLKPKKLRLSLEQTEAICREGCNGYDPWRDRKGYTFDPEAARDAIRFFHEELTHVKGAKARQGFVLERWQKSLIGNLFGWFRKDGSRRYRQALVFVPRKNGKTPLAAGIILYALMEDREPGAEIYGAASEYGQASLVWEHARGMVLQNENMKARCQIFKGQAKAIQLTDHEDNIDEFGTYRVICSEAGSAHGYNTHIAVVDELHTQKNRELVDALETSTSARSSPLLIHITTSDFEREGSICNEKHAYASQVRDGIINDPEFLPCIYEATIDDDWTDPAVWHKANPNLGVSKSLAYMKQQCKKAQEVPSFENTFKRLDLNIRTEQDERWLVLEQWDACGASEVDPADLEGKPCYAGLDLASTTDIAAFVLLFPESGNAVLPFFWAPKDGAEKRSRTDKVDYLTWGRQGIIELTPGNVIDYDIIRKRIVELGERFNIREIAIDRWNSTQLATQLAGDGFEIVAFGQGFQSMTAPTKELERLVMSEELRHGANPILRWMASNVAVERNSVDDLKPSKKKSSEKIDGIVSLVMALGRAMLEETYTSVYDTDELLVL